MSGVIGLSVSIKFNKQGIEKIRKQMEKELNRQIQIGVSDLRKDSEKFLEIVLREREKIGEDALRFDLEDFKEIPNIQMNIKTILDDLKIHGCISDNSSLFLGGKTDIYLTMEGIEYFNDKERVNQVEQMSGNVNNFYGPVSNMQMQQGTVNSTQTQTITTESIDFEKVSEFIERVKKYDPLLEDEYGEQATEVREKLDEISVLVQKKENPGKIKSLLMELKNLSVGVGGSLIATGIVEGIKLLFM